MEYNEHLVQTFCISRPALCSEQLNQSQLSKIEVIDSQRFTKNQQEKDTQKNTLGCKRRKKFSKIFDMIQKQIDCSAAVKFSQRPKKKLKKQKDGQNNPLLIHHFQQFFKGFIKQPQQDEVVSTRLRSSKKKTTYKIRDNCVLQKQNDQAEFEQEEDLRYTVDQKKTQKQKNTYYQRMKAKLQHKVRLLVSKQIKDNVSSKFQVQMSNSKERQAVIKILKDKEKNRKNDPLRISRTGLTVRLSQVQRQIKGTNLAMIQDHKIKKDMLFKKSLYKNCHSVISRMQSQKESIANRPKSRLKSQSSLHANDGQHIMNKKNERAMTAGKSRYSVQSSEDINKLKWQYKYLSIEYQCESHYDKYRNVRGGLNIFKRYCSTLQNKFKRNSQNIGQALRTEDARNYDTLKYETLSEMDINKILHSEIIKS